jgi:hypothetical protein
MYKVYADGLFIEECRGRITGGATLVLDQPTDIDALRALCLECENLESFRDWIPKYQRWMEWFEAGAGPSDYPSLLRASNEQTVHPDNLSNLHQLGDALRIAKEVWEAAASDAENLRALVAVTSDHSDINYEAELLQMCVPLTASWMRGQSPRNNRRNTARFARPSIRTFWLLVGPMTR